MKKRGDMQIKCVKDYLTNAKPSGYRSYHLIIYYTVETIDGPRKLQAEIQIRTMAMNFWATTSIPYSIRLPGQHSPVCAHPSEQRRGRRADDGQGDVFGAQ